MRLSTLKTFTAVALATAGCVSFAQPASDAYGTPTTSADVDRSTTGYPAYSQSRDPNRACVGLSDRQTERACRQGSPIRHADVPNSMSSDYGGLTDDQAD